MSMLELNTLRQTPLVTQPFEYLIVPQFVKAECLEAIERDFPPITSGGSFPLASLQYGVSMNDPLSWSVVLAIIAIVTIVASWRPAQLALQADPVVLLKDE